MPRGNLDSHPGGSIKMVGSDRYKWPNNLPPRCEYISFWDGSSSSRRDYLRLCYCQKS